MTTLQTEKPEAQSSLSSNQMQLKLDIFAGDQWTHSMELPAGKCTIGSSPSCQIRLPEGQVRPLHCLLVRNEEGISATSWAPGVLLNEQEFSSAPVYAGDVLSIGSLQLKLSLGESIVSDSPQHDKEDTVSQARTGQPPSSLAAPQPHELVEQPSEIAVNECPAAVTECDTLPRESNKAESNKHARERCRRLIEVLRHQRDESKSFQQESVSNANRLEAAEQERHSLATELEQLRYSSTEATRNLTDQLQSLQSERDWLTGEVEQIRSNSADETQRLGEQLASVQSEREAISHELEQLRTNFADQCSELTEQLKSVQEERDSLTTDLEQLRENTSQQNRQLSEQFDGVQKERDSLAFEFEQLRNNTDHQTHDLSEQLSAAQADRDNLSAELNQLQVSSADLETQFKAEMDRIIGELSEAYEKSNHTESALQESQAQLADLHRQIEELAGEREQLARASQELQNEKEQAASALAERDDRITHIESEILAAREATQVAEEKLADQIVSQEEAEAELSALRANHAETVSELESLQRESAEMRHDFPALQQKLHTSEESLRASNEQVEQLNSELDSLRSELDTMRSECDQLTAGKETLTTENAEQRKRNELLAIDVKSLKNEWQQAQADVSRLKEARLAAESRVEQLEAEHADFDKEAFEAVTSERTQLSEQVQSLQRDLTAREEVLQAAENRLEELHSTVFQSETDQASLREELAERVGQIERLTTELKSVNEDVVKHTEDRSLFEMQLDEHEKTIEELRSQIDDLKTNITQVEQERNEAAHAFATQEAKFSELKEEFEAYQADALRREADWEEHFSGLSDKESQIAQLKMELDKFKSRISEVEQVRDELSGQIASQEAHTANLKEELESLRSKDSSLDEEHEEYARCIATQVDQIEQLTSQLDSIRERVSLVEQERDHVTNRLASRDTDAEKLSADLDESRKLLAEAAQQAQDLKIAYEVTLEELEQARSLNHVTQSNEDEEALIEQSIEAEPLLEDTSSEIERTATETVVLLNGAADLTAEVEEDDPQDATPEFQPTSFIDKYSHLLDENDLGHEQDLLETTSAPVGRLPEVEPPTEALAGEGDDGDLEAYMSSLMRRVRGDGSSDSSSHQVRKEYETNANRDSSNLNAGKNSHDNKIKEPAAITSTEHQGLLDMAELKANCTRSAQPIDLAAMRELANSSARSAIATHRKQRHFEGALGKFLVTAAAGGTAASMILSADNYYHPLFLGGCAIGVISAYWGLKLMGTFLEMIRDGSDKTEVIPAGLTDERDSLPIDGSLDITNQRSVD